MMQHPINQKLRAIGYLVQVVSLITLLALRDPKGVALGGKSSWAFLGFLLGFLLIIAAYIPWPRHDAKREREIE